MPSLYLVTQGMVGILILIILVIIGIFLVGVFYGNEKKAKKTAFFIGLVILVLVLGFLVGSINSRVNTTIECYRVPLIINITVPHQSVQFYNVCDMDFPIFPSWL